MSTQARFDSGALLSFARDDGKVQFEIRVNGKTVVSFDASADQAERIGDAIREKARVARAMQNADPATPEGE